MIEPIAATLVKSIGLRFTLHLMKMLVFKPMPVSVLVVLIPRIKGSLNQSVFLRDFIIAVIARRFTEVF
jgi:hypothetical protein